jgi:Trp operon repressor
MSHRHLNIEQRTRLYQLCQEENLSQRQIAVLLGWEARKIQSTSIMLQIIRHFFGKEMEKGG